MRIVLFCHSLISDWNHGNAHFIRGVVSELIRRGQKVAVYEPHDAWSVAGLVAAHGMQAIDPFRRAYPGLESIRYDSASLDLDEALDGASLVLVHEWNEPDLVRRIGEHRYRSGAYTLLFHDTHHRAVTKPAEMSRYDLSSYDAVLAFGEVLRDVYVQRGWAERVFTWHEGADVRLFRPLPAESHEGELIWIGNWGDDERTAELLEFIVQPVVELGVRARIHGVRYPPEILDQLHRSGIDYAGWLPNFDVPRVFARFACTVHVPRRPYVRALSGIPTIRVFEALACGIPLVIARWEDTEGLFQPGRDYLTAGSGAEMLRRIRDLTSDAEMRRELAAAGTRTILERHTCAHRVDELLSIHRALRPAPVQEVGVG